MKRSTRLEGVLWAALWALAGCDAPAESGRGAAADARPDAAAVVTDAEPGDAHADAAPLPSPTCAPPFFPPDAPWNRDVTAAPTAADSASIIGHLADVGFGLGRLQTDFSFDYFCAAEDTPTQTFTPTGDFYTPDCDAVPMPVPPGARLEGEAGLECTTDGDCHLLVLQPGAARLYEMWRADFSGGVFAGGCLAVWDLSRAPGPEGRGRGCTSADAAGLPITPLLFDADEGAAGEIRHAIRFILPNDRIRSRAYVPPATHATGAASGGADSPPYGAHLRLRADFDLARLPNEAARTVARALQRHGMFLADGGNVALTARSDAQTTAKWATLGFDSHSLEAITPSDFEVLDAGPAQAWDGDCVRAP
jgi:hypothetical protein